MHDGWDFNAVPWVVGKDFKAPTCSTCHNSLVVSPQGDIIVERSHDFGARLWVRLFGLIYAHPQPKSGNTTIIKNKDGLPLPTAFSGEPATDYLIDKAEQEGGAVCNHQGRMQRKSRVGLGEPPFRKIRQYDQRDECYDGNCDTAHARCMAEGNRRQIQSIR